MSPVLPREERDAIRARVEAATDGPWRTWNDGHVGSPTVHIGGGVMPTPGSDPAQRMPDAEFIAHARTDVPALLDALDAAEEENERLRGEGRDAHERLVMECMAMGWATDGRLSTGVGHAIEYIRRLAAERDAARAEVAALRGLFSGGPDTPCRTTWRADGFLGSASTECVEVPMADLRAALAADEGEGAGR